MNELLLWMSARRSGSMRSFRSRVAALDGVGGRIPHRIVQWNLSKLGHAEFAPAAASDGWRIAPPILAAGDPHQGGRAFLCGARTPSIVERMNNACGSQLLRRPQAGGPDIIEIAAPSATALQAHAAAAGIEIQWNASLAIIACCVPPAALELTPAELPLGGWEVFRFSKSGLAWVASSPEAARQANAGLFRFQSDFETHYFLIENGAAFVADAAAAKYRLLRRRQAAIAYRSSDRAILIRASCRPPSLVERALVLSSGALPTFADGTLIYNGIEAAVASAVANFLDQRLT